MVRSHKYNWERYWSYLLQITYIYLDFMSNTQSYLFDIRLFILKFCYYETCNQTTSCNQTTCVNFSLILSAFNNQKIYTWSSFAVIITSNERSSSRAIVAVHPSGWIKDSDIWVTRPAYITLNTEIIDLSIKKGRYLRSLICQLFPHPVLHEHLLLTKFDVSLVSPLQKKTSNREREPS